MVKFLVSFFQKSALFGQTTFVLFSFFSVICCYLSLCVPVKPGFLNVPPPFKQTRSAFIKTLFNLFYRFYSFIQLQIFIILTIIIIIITVFTVIIIIIISFS